MPCRNKFQVLDFFNSTDILFSENVFDIVQISGLKECLQEKPLFFVKCMKAQCSCRPADVSVNFQKKKNVIEQFRNSEWFIFMCSICACNAENSFYL